ncbi:TPA: hypothetical protein ACHYK7_RS21650, partial [Escherichia coli]
IDEKKMMIAINFCSTSLQADKKSPIRSEGSYRAFAYEVFANSMVTTVTGNHFIICNITTHHCEK